MKRFVKQVDRQVHNIVSDWEQKPLQPRASRTSSNPFPSPEVEPTEPSGDTHGVSQAEVVQTSDSEQSSNLVFSPTKRQIASIDRTRDVAELRWVRTEFICFLDIPMNHELVSRSTFGLSMYSLTFDLLEDILDMKISKNILLEGSGKGQYISADNLARMVVPWARDQIDNIHHLSPKDKTAYLQYGKYCRERLLKLTQGLDDTVYSRTGSLVNDGPLSTALSAVAVFLTCLEMCIRAIWSIEGPEIVEQTRMYGEVTQILRQLFYGAGWGLSGFMETERLIGAGIPFVVFAMNCDPTITNTINVDTEQYCPKHICPSGNCSFIKPSFDSVRDLISTNKIPVLTYDGTSIHVRSATDSPYVAISHVWADGLGSNTETGLPTCQVERLTRLCRDIGVTDGAFWQDGLCIPEQRDLRDQAIVSMKEVYADATKVLVLDAGLRAACQRLTPKELCLLRIATCGWMQRIWTLQEGMLAHELYFELGDGIIDCTHFNGSAYIITQKLLPMLNYRRGPPSSLAYQQYLKEPPSCTINGLIPLLRYRVTSKPRDEPVAICGLLGVDTRKIVPLKEVEARIKQLLIEVRHVPRQLVVMGWMEPRSSLPNFTWAPSSLTYVLWPEDPEDPIEKRGICTEDGLFSDFTLVRFSKEIVAQEDAVVLINIDGDPNINPSHVFNLVFSPPYVRQVYSPFPWRFPVGGCVIKGSIRESMREEGVGAIAFLPDDPHLPHPTSRQSTTTCKFKAPASFRFGEPDKVETARTRSVAHSVRATVEYSAEIRMV